MCRQSRGIKREKIAPKGFSSQKAARKERLKEK